MANSQTLVFANDQTAVHAPASSATVGTSPSAQGGVNASNEYTTNKHTMSLSELANEFKSTHIDTENVQESDGLAPDDAASILKTHGPNRLTPPAQVPEWKKFVKHFGHLLLVLLEIAGVLGFVAFGLNGDPLNLILGIVLFVLVLLTATMNYMQERAASDVLARIQGMLPAFTRVIRGGSELMIPAHELVPGDLVRLTIGARVPADIRVLSAADFKVEMSSLTGESDAIECGPDCRSTRPTEARNLIFNSTLVLSGECRGLVIKTGDDTMIGSIAGLAGKTAGGAASSGMTTMEKEILRVVYFIASLAIVTACAFFGVGMGRGLGLVFSLVNAFILVLVANVPEGLPATVSSILQLTAKMLVERKILIKRTELIETLGSCSVIASDKTGTLTQNRMTVENVWTSMTYHKARMEIVRRPMDGETYGSSPGLGPRSRSNTGRSLASPTLASVQAAMTIGRGMSFISLSGDALSKDSAAGAIAVIHSTTANSTTPASASSQAASASIGGSLRNMNPSSGLTLNKETAMSLGTSAAADGGLNTNGLVLLSASDLRPAAVGGTAPGSRPSNISGMRRSHLSAIFDRQDGIEEDTPSGATPAYSGEGPLTDVPEDQEEVELDKGGNEGKPTSGHESQAGMEGASQNMGSAVPAVATPLIRADVGLPGSDLILTGFSGPLLDAVEVVSMGDAYNRRPPAGLGQPGGIQARTAVLEPTPDSPLGATSGDLGSDVSTNSVAEQAVAVQVADWPATAQSAARSPTPALPKLLSSSSTGSSSAFLQHVSFQSFRGFTKAVWAQTNAFSRMCVIAAVCNKAVFSADGQPIIDDKLAGKGDTDRKTPRRNFPVGVDPRVVLGDASDAAMLRYVDALAPIFEWRSTYPVLFEIPFNSTTKVSLVITRCPEDPKSHLVLMKGAPERIIAACSHHFTAGHEVPVDDKYLKQWAAAYERFGVMGERVLGFAYAKIPARAASVYKSDPESFPSKSGLVFAGMMSLVDPPKVGTEQAVAVCKGAGIRVIMVTGDHPLTAEAIARKVGIITLATIREVAAKHRVPESEVPFDHPEVGALVVAGHDIPSLTAAQWSALIAKREVVFARTSPQQKLQIVEAYQAAGHVVAVTGDGTNDAPALKRADIGVAMGSANASDVAREAADMIILDDDFASIVHAIAQGRVVFENIKKTVAYTITHLWPELIPILILLALDLPIMLTGLLILLVDCVTEQGPAISLTYEPAESSVMLRPPRDLKQDRLVDFPLLFYSYIVMGVPQTAVCSFAFVSIFMQAGVPLSYLIYHPAQWVSGAPPLGPLPDGRVLSGDDQVTLYRTAVAAYFLNLVLCQAWNIFFTKTRRVSLLQHPGVITWAGVSSTLTGLLVAVVVMLVAIYAPVLNTFFGCAPAPGIAWTPHFLFGAYGLLWTETVKAGARKEEEEAFKAMQAAGNDQARPKKGWIATYLAW